MQQLLADNHVRQDSRKASTQRSPRAVLTTEQPRAHREGNRPSRLNTMFVGPWQIGWALTKLYALPAQQHGRVNAALILQRSRSDSEWESDHTPDRRRH